MTIMANMIIGTGIWTDFPTEKGHIYPYAILESLVNNQLLQKKIASGKLIGGILDKNTLGPVGDIITHKIKKLIIYNGELCVELEMLDDPAATLLVSSITNLEAAVIIKCPLSQPNSNGVFNKIDDINAIHLREKSCLI